MRWLFGLLLSCSAPVAPVVDSHAVESSVALPHCRGTWVGEVEIVTAAHCVAGVEVGEYVLPGVRLAKVHELVDLAILEWPSGPSHSWAALATGNHYGGEDVTVVGGRVSRGQVVAERWITPPRGGTARALQVSVTADVGDSGGGAFDAAGKLVGVCSFVRDGDVFFTHSRHVAELMVAP